MLLSAGRLCVEAQQISQIETYSADGCCHCKASMRAVQVVFAVPLYSWIQAASCHSRSAEFG